MKKSFKVKNTDKKYIKIMRKVTGLKYYIKPMNDSRDLEFTSAELQNITVIDDDFLLNSYLMDNDAQDCKYDVLALMDEGVLPNIPTGADLGIYDYNPIDTNRFNTSHSFKAVNDSYDFATVSFGEEDDFKDCVLAEYNSLGGEHTQVILTFKGYLIVTKTGDSVLYKSNFNNSKINEVHIPRYYVDKYMLRCGDEIICTCKDVDGKIMLDNLLTINEIPYYDWKCDRMWFNQLQLASKSKKLTAGGEYTAEIIKKFNLVKGDNVFIYINKTSQKSCVVPKLITELTTMFDKIVYINPKDNSINKDSFGSNVITFCAKGSDEYEFQTAITLLGVNYVKRMIELGKHVALVVDDIDAISTLDNKYLPEMPVCKTVLNCCKSTLLGSGTSFVAVPLRSELINTFTPYMQFRSVETLGIVMDNNQIDLFNSYRM